MKDLDLHNVSNNELDRFLNPHFGRYEAALLYAVFFTKKGVEFAPADVELAPHNEYYFSNLLKRLKENLENLSVHEEELLCSKNGFAHTAEHYRVLVNYFITEYGTALSILINFLEQQISELRSKPASIPSGNKMILLYTQELSVYKGDFENLPNVAAIIESKRSQLQAGTPVLQDRYNPKAKWSDKIIHVLDRESRLLSLNEIVDILLVLEPSLIGANERRDLSKNVAGLLRYYVSENIIVRKESAYNDNFVYGKPNWLDKNNSVLEAYREAI